MKHNIVLLTGMSGAGKSSAMNALEDLGYYCIDNFPVELLSQLEIVLESNRYKYVAFSVPASDYNTFYHFFENTKHNIRSIFLDASDEELLLRYRFTRRRHPLIATGIASTLDEAIEIERDQVLAMQESAPDTIHFDTTKMTTTELARRIRNRLEVNESAEFTITFQSFGFKHGMPMDADIVMDVRFLPNPFYDPTLRDLTGNNKEVYDFVINARETQTFLGYLKSTMDYVFDSYNKQHKSHMIVAIGCTGGQHRSVSVCNWLYDHYKKNYRCFKSHRDIGGEEE